MEAKKLRKADAIAQAGKSIGSGLAWLGFWIICAPLALKLIIATAAAMRDAALK